MKTNKIQDERILLTRRKIQSDAYGLLVWVLTISIIVQQFFLKAPFSQYAFEVFILLGCGLYTSIRYFKEGIDIWTPKGSGKKGVLLLAAVGGAAAVITCVVMLGKRDVSFLTSYFVTYLLSFFAARSVIIGKYKKKQQEIENELNEDEMNE